MKKQVHALCRLPDAPIEPCGPNAVSIGPKELFERDLVLEIRGSKLQRRRAKKYAEGAESEREQRGRTWGERGVDGNSQNFIRLLEVGDVRAWSGTVPRVLLAPLLGKSRQPFRNAEKFFAGHSCCFTIRHLSLPWLVHR